MMKRLRERGYNKPIIMVSANAGENDKSHLHPNTINSYIVKPIRFNNLLDKLNKSLAIEWLYEPKEPAMMKNQKQAFNRNSNNEDPQWSVLPTEGLPDRDSIIELIELAKVGHLSELKNKIQQLKTVESVDEKFINVVSYWLSEVRFDSLIKALNAALEKDNK